MIDAKKLAAKAAVNLIEDDTVVGVGTGSTVNFFIEELSKISSRIDGAVASSNATKALLQKYNIPVLDLNVVDSVSLYIDGADEVDSFGRAIKGGGGALTREKIIANVAKKWVCIVDYTKLVKRLGAFPVAVEVIPVARSYVARELVKLNMDPVYREGFVTDNGNIILDAYNLPNQDLLILEQELNQIAGLVCHGLFAKTRAAKILLGSRDNVVEAIDL